ncbi:spermidine/putrescine ABC transporter substrate-binding protein [Psychromonas sp. GE-S-Ul-11]|jgi:spermidine/putrescine transport system substrate-binding protein|uniref:polyamine ABC transporter substrate-binding protein n=1 Tax=Psychromonas sp. GE-S-Ul-11 TaxID=3241170 RepID=UPI00390C4073
MKNVLKTLLALTFSLPLNAQEIKVFIWEHFISEEIINEFTQKTGHTVKQYFFDSEVDRNALLMNGQGIRYDLVLVDNATAKRYGETGVLAVLPTLEIDNLQNNSLKSRESCGQYGVPYSTGTMGIAYRSSIAKKKVDSWNDIITPADEHIGTTMMLKDDLDTVAVALLAQGFGPFSNNKNELKSAYALLKAQSQYLLGYGYPLSYVDEQKSASKLTLSVIYSGDIFNLKQATGQNDWTYVVPKEGTLLFIDCLAAPGGKPITEATKTFLSFINEPTVAYKNASEMWFSTTNEAAKLIADDDYKNDSEISPNAEVINRSEYYKIISDEDLVIRNRMVSILNIQE